MCASSSVANGGASHRQALEQPSDKPTVTTKSVTKVLWTAMFASRYGVRSFPHLAIRIYRVSQSLARELVAYFNFTLEVIEQSPRRYRDELATAELAMLLRRHITELEREMEARPAHSNFFRFLACTGFPQSAAMIFHNRSKSSAAFPCEKKKRWRFVLDFFA